MNSIKPEWPLVVFTTFAPLCAGVWIVAATLVLFGMLPQSNELTTGLFGVLLCLLLIASLGVSVLHLGKPMKALRAFTRLGNSTISNEVFAGTLFAILLVLYLIVMHSMTMLNGVSLILYYLVTAFAVLFVLFQCLAYRMRTVPTWNSASFSIDFAGIALVGGICVGGILACLSSTIAFDMRLALVVAEATSCAGILLVICAQGAVVMKNVLHRNNAKAVVKSWLAFSMVRVSVLLIGSIMWCLGMLEAEPALPLMALGALAVIASVAIGRFAFYRLYVSVGLPRV